MNALPAAKCIRVICYLFLFAAVPLFFANAIFAQEAPKGTAKVNEPNASPPPTSSASPSASPSPLPKVTAVIGVIELQNTLQVQCDGLKDWAKKGSEQPKNDPSKLILYLDGTAMKGLVPKTDKVNANELLYKLQRLSGTDENKDDNRKAWDALFSRPKGIGQYGGVRVTIGPENAVPFDSDASDVRMIAIRPYGFWGWVAFSILLLIGIVKLARQSDLLRDPGEQPPNERKAFSLARSQMAFWFFLIVVAYLFLFMVTGATDTITSSVLGLMGISAATGLAAVAVDNSKQTQAQTEVDKLKTEQGKLQEEQRALAAGASLAPEKVQRLNDLPTLIQRQENLLHPTPTKGFILDILSDPDGVSFHRLQIAVWTVVLGIIFVHSVYNVLCMPTFSETLLGLMGISGGTYIGFKIPEKLN